MTLLFS